MHGIISRSPNKRLRRVRKVGDKYFSKPRCYAARVPSAQAGVNNSTRNRSTRECIGGGLTAERQVRPASDVDVVSNVRDVIDDVVGSSAGTLDIERHEPRCDSEFGKVQWSRTGPVHLKGDRRIPTQRSRVGER